MSSLCFVRSKKQQDESSLKPALLYESPKQALEYADDDITKLERRDVAIALLRHQLRITKGRMKLVRVFDDSFDRIYNLSDETEDVELFPDDFYAIYLQSMERFRTNPMKRLFQAHQRLEHINETTTRETEEQQQQIPSSPDNRNSSSPIIEQEIPMNDSVEEEEDDAIMDESSLQQLDIRVDDSIEIVLQKYEATHVWHRRIDTNFLHDDIKMYHCKTNQSYEIRDFLQEIVCRDHPHWKLPPKHTPADSQHEEEEEEASCCEDEESTVANEDVMPSQSNDEEDDLSLQKPPPKRRRRGKPSRRPTKKHKTTALPKSLLQSLTAIGVEFQDDTCFFAKEPKQVFQSIQGLLRFIVMNGCPAPTKKPAQKHINALNQFIQSQFPILTNTIRKHPLLSYERIRCILTDNKNHHRFEVCDGHIYDPTRTRRSAAECRTNVDRFDENDSLRIANCILRKQINKDPNVLRWCAEYAGLQIWKSDRERPDDWDSYLTTEEITTTKVARTRKPASKSTRYWQTQDLPLNNDVTPLLRALGVDAGDGSVRMFGRVFSMLAARKIFCRYGLPKLPSSASETLRRWVAFANIGIASHNSSRVLCSVRSLEGDRLKRELMALGFYFEAGIKIFVPNYRSLQGGPNMFGTKYQHGVHYFKDNELLTEVRSYVRCRPDIMEEASIEVRLWACVSSLAALAQMQDGIETTDEFRQFLDEVELVVNHDEDSWDGSANVASPKATPSEIDVSSAAADTRSISSPSSCGSSDSELEWYQRTGSIPRFNDVYRYLEKIGFSWSGVFYLKTPISKFTFDSHLAIAKFLMTHGIPNADDLSLDERKKISRWATFAFVPVPLSESGKVLRRVVPPSTKKSTQKLLTKFGFTVQGSGILPPGASNTGEVLSLDQVRVFIRSREEHDFNVLPVELRPRSTRQKLSASDDDRLALRLWAATAPDPLPEFVSSPRSKFLHDETNTSTQIDAGTPDSVRENEANHVSSIVDKNTNRIEDGNDYQLGEDNCAVDMMEEQNEPVLDDGNGMNAVSTSSVEQRTSAVNKSWSPTQEALVAEAYLTQEQPESNDDLLDEIVPPLGDIVDGNSGVAAAAEELSTKENLGEPLCSNGKTPYSGVPMLQEHTNNVNGHVGFLTQDHAMGGSSSIQDNDHATVAGPNVEMELVPDLESEDTAMGQSGAMNGFMTQDVSDWDTGNASCSYPW